MVIVLQQKEHDLFTRKGGDLYCTYNIGLAEALCGFSFVLKHLDNRELLVSYPAGKIIQPGMPVSTATRYWLPNSIVITLQLVVLH